MRESLPSRVPVGSPPIREPLPTDSSVLPALPDDFRTTLEAGLASLGLALSADQHAALDAYVRLLLRWTEAINLTAIREPEAVARQHLVDSLTATAVLAGSGSIADLGSGGGAPGLPLAIALPAARVALVESIGKKAGFLRAAVAAVGAVAPALDLPGRVDVVAERAEAMAVDGRGRGAFDAVTVRAVGPLPELIELAFPLLRPGGILVAWKRVPFDAELAAGRNAARALGGAIELRDIDVPGLDDRQLVVVEKTRPTPHRFPRPPAERRSHPL